MSLECPNGHGRQNVVENITADHKPTSKANDVIARRLACGCVVGGQEYADFQDSIHKIQIEEAAQIEKIRQASKNKKTAAYQALLKSRGQ